MGQAKRRGTYEERKYTAIQRQKKVLPDEMTDDKPVPVQPQGTEADPFIYRKTDMAMAGVVMAAMMASRKKRWRL